MKILVVNCGSSSVKYTFFDVNGEKKLASGIVECIGLPEAYFKHRVSGEEEVKESCKVQNHMEAVDLILKNLIDPEIGLIKHTDEISAVGHRVVHGGDKFTDSVVVDANVMEGLKECIPIAPLHNPHHYAGIEAILKLLPDVKQVLVFDTAFHQTIPDFAYIYAIPYSLYEKYHIRRYGFHGTSHKYVAQRAAKLLGKPLKDTNLITCHLGNGCSITAIKSGKSIDTSMGFTPLEGLVMGTRSGDIDPAIIVHLLTHEKITADSLNSLLNKKSGLAGVSGISADMRTLLTASAEGNQKAKLAIEIYCYRIKKYIASYMGVLEGTDAVVFTAGVGENSPTIRSKSCQGLDSLGIKIDEEANRKVGSEDRTISSGDSGVRILVIPTNEELMIARETHRVLTNG
ncbi:MAG: acetate kinase [Endomicrobiales bacterium]|nr:acetate kinase [Endomicrobiales bacterium]